MPTAVMISPTQSPPFAAALATRSALIPAPSTRAAHPSAASTGGDPNVRAGSIRVGCTPSLSALHAINNVAIEPPRLCPAQHSDAVGGSDSRRGATSGQNASVISATPAWQTTGTPGWSGAGHARERSAWRA